MLSSRCSAYCGRIVGFVTVSVVGINNALLKWLGTVGRSREETSALGRGEKQSSWSLTRLRGHGVNAHSLRDRNGEVGRKRTTYQRRVIQIEPIVTLYEDFCCVFGRSSCNIAVVPALVVFTRAGGATDRGGTMLSHPEEG